MNEQEKFERFVNRYPHQHKFIAERPHLSRRDFFQLAGAGVTLGMLASPAKAGSTVITSQPVTMQNKAKYCIFVLMAGAPSHTDMFDLKMVNGTTPASFTPSTVNGVYWPTGLMPKMATRLNNVAIVRSMRAWALVHTLSQTWTQIGRNPAAALGNIAPNIGSVVSIEKEPERQAGQVFPTFLSFNANNGAKVTNGYFPATFAPFQVAEGNNANANTVGLANTTNSDGQSASTERYSQLQALDAALRTNSPYGKPMEDMANFYSSAVGLEYNANVNKAFQYSALDAARYGGTSFGNACLAAKQVLAANQGTRYIQITVGGWDMHTNIYGNGTATDTSQSLNPLSTNCLAKQFDNGMSALLDDLTAAGILNETLVVAVGEFGRTTGAVTPAGGRDHYLQQSILFAGAGIHGGRALGVTDAAGQNTVTPGWKGNRDVKPEDVEATIYSALGINWTTIRYDDPFGRGFEYVPFGSEGLYFPIDDLWT